MNLTAAMALSPTPAGSHREIAFPSSARYDKARLAWNLSLDQRPDAVLEAESPHDVAAAVFHARRHGWQVAPQGTGHGGSPLGSLRGTLLVRTGRMRGVQIDPIARVARVQAGAVWRDVIDAAARHGLAAVAGVPDVGVAGYALGGGLSFLSRKYGLACNSIVAVELVTADGRIRRISAEREPELFWAVRGGGGNFGVVTAIDFALFPMTHAHAGILWFPIDRGPEVLEEWVELTRREVPDELTTIGRFLKFPPLSEIPELIRGQAFVVVEVFNTGEQEPIDRLLAGLRALGPVNDTIARIPVTELGRVHMDPEQPTPMVGDGMMLADLPSAALEAFVETAGAASGFALLSTELRHLGAAISRQRSGSGALASIDAPYAMYSVSVAPQPEMQVAARRAVDDIRSALSPYAAAQMYLNLSESSRDVDAFWPAEVFDRLRAVKAAVDPDGLIRANHAIPAAV